MTLLSRAIAEEVQKIVSRQLQNLSSEEAQLRAVFNGPPAEILHEVFRVLAEGGGITTALGDGKDVVVPVLVVVDKLQAGALNPAIGVSGFCDSNHILDVRNSPQCPRFLVLSAPGIQSNLSQNTTWFDCGLSPQNNAGNCPIAAWWQDDFVQELVSSGLRRLSWPSDQMGESAKNLVREAVYAADSAERYGSARSAAWRVLSRIWSINTTNANCCDAVSLACGFPPVSDGTLNPDDQIKALRELAERLEDGFRPTVDALKGRADGEKEREALDAFLNQLQDRCSVPTAVTQGMAYYYGPSISDVVESAPTWWTSLTLSRLQDLLEEDSFSPEALEVKCLNAIAPVQSGIPTVVRSRVELEIKLPGDAKNHVNIRISREGQAAHRRSWDVLVKGGVYTFTDDEIPEHKRAIKYVISSPVFKPASIHVICMAQWEPGVFVSGRNARKVTAPKPSRVASDKVALETYLTLHAQGRHYLDLYVRPGVTLNETALGTDHSASTPAEQDQATVAAVSEGEYGLEVRAGADTSYDLEYSKDAAQKPLKLRIFLACDDDQSEQCNSEFERLILLNRTRKERQLSSSVHVNRTHRAADLQGWMLAKESSYYPLVFGPDYADTWRVRNWTSQEETIISRGKFLSDPRPAFDDMQPPAEFITARRAISDRIQTRNDGLIQAAPLGEWLANDAVFQEEVDSYLRAYNEWLEQAPDIAAWCDLAIITDFESDHKTLVLEPDAILVSPLHPVRLAWHCASQRALVLSHRKRPCPAASILDPRCIPDAIALPLRTAAGSVRSHVFFSVECDSDYWSVLWNSSRSHRIGETLARTPFDSEFGILIGGLSSSFSVSQVNRSLNDISDLLAAKATLNVSVTSASSQNSATNDGLIQWCREHFAPQEDEGNASLVVGRRFLRVLDQRTADHRPEEAAISNLAEDTQNAVSWYETKNVKDHAPDLTIVAQLETSNMSAEETTLMSPLSVGGLFRVRIRQQLKAASGAFLSESRMGVVPTPSGDAILDRTASALARLENLGPTRYSYVFAPSVHTLQTSLNNSRYVAVSSAAVDPACFLGGWLSDTYLWDYDLPSYSSRAGDSNGYYLLAQITDVDRDTLRSVVQKLPGCGELPATMVDNLILEVARRGIPTVRGLSSGDSGAMGDLGLFVAARLLQDEFRVAGNVPSLFPIWRDDSGNIKVNLLIPVDPFRSYLDDLTRAVGKNQRNRPDLLLLSLSITDSQVRGRITAVEVKYRGSTDMMSPQECQTALGQAKSFASLLEQIVAIAANEDMLTWRLAYKHLFLAFLDYGFRVYSQQAAIIHRGAQWASCQTQVTNALMAGTLEFEVDVVGRLIVIDGAATSEPRDVDGDGFAETIGLSRKAAASVIAGDCVSIYDGIRSKLGAWGTEPAIAAGRVASTQTAPEHGSTGSTPVVTPARAEVSTTQRIVEVSGDRGSTEGDVSEAAPVRQNEEATASDVGATNGVHLAIGEPLDAFVPEARVLSLSDTNLNQLNIGVVGDLGTGKTQLLKSLIYQITQQQAANKGVAPNVLIFDYKKDYSNEEFVKATGARVIRPRHLRLNLFDVSQAADPTTAWLDRFSFFADVLDKIYSGIGPVQRKALKAAVRAAYNDRLGSGVAPTIYDVHRHYELVTNNKADSVSSIIEDLVDRELFAPDAADASAKEFLSGVVVISLDALGQDDKSKNMLVAVLLNTFYENMLKIPKRPFYGIDPQKRVIDSFLLVDEADNIMKYEFDVLRRVLLQGREFGVGVILASQYLRHFRVGATDYREPLLTWLIHKVPNVQAQELSALGMTTNLQQTAERIKSLGLHECMYKTFNVAGEFVKGTPFYQIVKK